MSKISTYSTVTPAAGDKVIGTDVAGTPTDATKNFLVEDIAALAGTQGLVNLSQVLTAGNTATNNINLTGNITASLNVTALGLFSTDLTSTGGVVLGTAGGTAIITNANISALGGVFVPNTATTQLGGVVTFGASSEVSFLSGSVINALLPAHRDDAAAVAAGLTTGTMYQTDGTGTAPLNAAGIVMVVQ